MSLADGETAAKMADLFERHLLHHFPVCNSFKMSHELNFIVACSAHDANADLNATKSAWRQSLDEHMRFFQIDYENIS